MIKEEFEGNIITMFQKGKFDAICQGNNCFCLMGAGLAVQIAYHFPMASIADNLTKHGDLSKMGTYTKAKVKNGYIINAYTQYYPGAYFEYLALINVLKKINKDFKGKHIGFPEIGCGIGGGDWSIVRKLIDENTPDIKVTIVHYDEGIETVSEVKIDIQPKLF